MLWKRLFIGDTGEDLALHVHCSGLPGATTQVTWVQLRRWSWKGHLLMTLRKNLQIHCSGLSGDLIVNMIVWSEDGLEKAINWWHWGRNSVHSLFRSTGKQTLESIVYSKDGLEKAVYWWHWEGLCSDLTLWVDTVVFLRRWSLKCCMSVTLGKTLPCTFIAQVSWEKALQLDMIVLLRGWSWKGHLSVTLGKTALQSLLRYLRRQSSWRQYIIFSQKMVVKRPFNGYIGAVSVFHINCSGL